MPRLKADTLVTFEWENVVDVLGECSSNLLGLHPGSHRVDCESLLGFEVYGDYSVVVDNCEILPVNVFTPRDGTTRTTPSSSWASSPGGRRRRRVGVHFQSLGQPGLREPEVQKRKAPGMETMRQTGCTSTPFCCPTAMKTARSTFSVSAEEGTGGQVKTRASVRSADMFTPMVTVRAMQILEYA